HEPLLCFTHPPTTESYTLSLHDALPIWGQSMTIWGVLISAAASVLPVLAPVLGLELTAELVRQVGDEVLQVGQAVTALVGTLIADRKSTRLNSSHVKISYAVFCLKKKKT